jgi:NADPH:quinone reductase-like Zn-dependent oxidoreductase
MKAFIVDRYKSNSALRLGEMPEPDVRDHDVLVAIHAASLNKLDGLLIRRSLVRARVGEPIESKSCGLVSAPALSK